MELIKYLNLRKVSNFILKQNNTNHRKTSIINTCRNYYQKQQPRLYFQQKIFLRLSGEKILIAAILIKKIIYVAKNRKINII